MKAIPLFVRQDIDGFFGLFIDNLIQLILIAALTQGVCGFPSTLVYGKILPAAGFSVLFGNLYYAWEAYRLAQKENRTDVCALPYGINTVSLISFVFFIMLPIFYQTGNYDIAWRVGVMACFISAIIELIVSFFGSFIRRVTPRAALLTALAGIGMTFIAMDFAFQIFADPLMAIIPFILLLISYFGKKRMPMGVPGGLYAILFGTALAWVSGKMDIEMLQRSALELRIHAPVLSVDELITTLRSSYLFQYISVIIPMALFNVIGSLQNIESAAAAGDSYPTERCLVANGVGSLVAAFLGSPFPTTVYIGHPGWKEMGARLGYSVLNGFVISVLCVTGGISFVSSLVPIEAGIGIVLWIGIIIMAQAYQATPRNHAPAIALGLIPALASWALMIIQGTLAKTDLTLAEIGANGLIQNYPLHGIISLSQGFILTSIIWSAMATNLLDKKLRQAAAWALTASVFSFFGLIHSYHLVENNILNHFGPKAGIEFALPYLVGALLLFIANNMKSTVSH